MKLVDICIYIYFLLKPFYLGKSGTLQISDVFILGAFLLTILNRKKEANEITKTNLKNLKYLLIFVICVSMINLFYSIFYSPNSFFTSTLYYIFIFLGIYTIIYKINDKELLKKIYIICNFNIILQLIIFILGFGRYYGSIRYMGTFNDPNQFGFFIVLMLMFIYVIKEILEQKNKINIFTFIAGTYLIFNSASTGMILAISTFLIIQLIHYINNFYYILKKHLTKIVIILILISLIISIILIIYSLDQDIREKTNYFIKENIFESLMYNRLLGKFEKVEEETDFWSDRHLEQIVNNPKYLIFGAGQGEYGRFVDYSYIGEIHSTLPSIMFYYGIIPTVILLCWIYKNVKGLNLKYMSVYIAILIESFTLLNQRQLLVWVLVVLATKLKKKGE